MGTWVYPEGHDPDEPLPDYEGSRYRIPDSQDEVERFLKRTFTAIRANKYVVLAADADEARSEDAHSGELPGRNISRRKNDEFRRLHGLTSEWELKDLLLSIDVSEFCHIKRTEDGRELYVFCLKRSLHKALVGTKEVLIYVKHDFPESEKRDVVVSLHELEKPIYFPYID